MIIEQAFETAMNAAGLRYVCDEECCVFVLPEGDPKIGDGTIQAYLRWPVKEFSVKCTTSRWRRDMIQKVKDHLRSRGMRGDGAGGGD